MLLLQVLQAGICWEQGAAVHHPVCHRGEGDCQGGGRRHAEADEGRRGPRLLHRRRGHGRQGVRSQGEAQLYCEIPCCYSFSQVICCWIIVQVCTGKPSSEHYAD